MKNIYIHINLRLVIFLHIISECNYSENKINMLFIKQYSFTLYFSF